MRGQICHIFTILSAGASDKLANFSDRMYKFWNHRFSKYLTMKISMCKQKNDKMMSKVSTKVKSIHIFVLREYGCYSKINSF